MIVFSVVSEVVFFISFFSWEEDGGNEEEAAEEEDEDEEVVGNEDEEGVISCSIFGTGLSWKSAPVKIKYRQRSQTREGPFLFKFY